MNSNAPNLFHYAATNETYSGCGPCLHSWRGLDLRIANRTPSPPARHGHAASSSRNEARQDRHPDRHLSLRQDTGLPH